MFGTIGVPELIIMAVVGGALYFALKGRAGAKVAASPPGTTAGADRETLTPASPVPSGSFIETENGPKEPVWLTGTGRGFYLEVVGESHYQDALGELWQEMRPERELSVRLMPERGNAHDANAVVVQTFRGVTVGYLGRDDAARYQQLVSQIADGGRIPVCQAKLHGGTQSKPAVGVWLDVEAPTKVAAALGLTYKRAKAAPATMSPTSRTL